MPARCSSGPAGPADTFPPPFPNDQAACGGQRLQGPPDFSVIAKARDLLPGSLYFLTDWLPFVGYSEQGPDYIHALLNGYEEPPKGFALPGGWSTTTSTIPDHIIAMPTDRSPTGWVSSGRTIRAVRSARRSIIRKDVSDLPDVGRPSRT